MSVNKGHRVNTMEFVSILLDHLFVTVHKAFPDQDVKLM